MEERLENIVSVSNVETPTPTAETAIENFPENDIEILEDYLSDQFISGMQAGLVAAILQEAGGEVFDSNGELAMTVLSARIQLRRFLLHPNFIKSLNELRTINEQVRVGDFPGAQGTLAAPGALPSLMGLFNLNLVSALRSSSITYKVKRPNNLPGKPDVIKTMKLPGYMGPKPTDEVGKRFVAWIDFLTDDNEYRFHVNLLNAEIKAGLAQFEEAIDQYSDLLGIIAVDSSRYKFVNIRKAFAYLAQGDQLFRKFRSPDGQIRHQIRQNYQNAINTVQSNAIAPENPLRQQIEQYAAVQLGKLDGGLNFVGYRDSFVPIIKADFLLNLAKERIEKAREAIGKFELFRSKADQIQDQLIDLDFDQKVKVVNYEIADRRVADANDQKRIADIRVEQIKSQLDALNIDLAAGLGSAVLQGAASAFLAGAPSGKPSDSGIGVHPGTNAPGVVGAAAGLVSTVTQYFARQDDLEKQKQIAGIQVGVAERDVQIALLEKQIIQNTIDFLGGKIKRIQQRELNPDLYYAAARAFRTLAERHMDAATELAYLFERAVAFRCLKPELQKVEFDYFSSEKQGSLLTAPDDLDAALLDVQKENIPSTKSQLLAESYSLRIFFPVEFNRFLQTGSMDFTLSLYELNKRRPGVWQQRIKRVGVQVKGSIPITGFTGRIIHRGSFLLRDKDTTPEPEIGRFVPTDEELSAVFEQLKNGATQGVPVGGVIPFVLNEEAIEISPDQLPPDLNDPAPEILQPIEGLGPAGTWRLEVENIDLRLVTDVELHFVYAEPLSDLDLARRIKGLIASYEKELAAEDTLDLITPISLRQQFTDVFFQLMNGQAELPLPREEFPSGITDLKLKTVIAQALDQNKKGIDGLTLEMARTGTAFDLVRTTLSDGFSEDVTVKPAVLSGADRFPVEGTYTLSLPDLGQASLLDDLILFFVYEYKDL